MNNAFKPVMDAMLAHLVAAATITFTATATLNNPTLTGVSNFAGLIPGLPVFGPGGDRGTTIQTINHGAGTITLTDPLTANASAGQYTTGFLTTGRRAIHWSQVSAQPALFLRRIGVTDEDDEPFTKTTLECEAWIYCNAGQNPDVAPDDALTALEQMIRTSFVPDGADDDDRFTLGGLAHRCRIEGRSDISPGDQGPQAIARIPIRITLP